MKTKIFVWALNAAGWYPGDVVGYAMTEDGRVLASHLSSGTEWAKHDMGITGTWKHDTYAKHCPDGYELEWVDDPSTNEAFAAALALNRKRAEAEK